MNIGIIGGGLPEPIDVKPVAVPIVKPYINNTPPPKMIVDVEKGKEENNNVNMAFIPNPNYVAPSTTDTSSPFIMNPFYQQTPPTMVTPNLFTPSPYGGFSNNNMLQPNNHAFNPFQQYFNQFQQMMTPFQQYMQQQMENNNKEG